MPAVGGINDRTYRQPYNESEPCEEFEPYHHISAENNAQDGYYRDKGAFKCTGMVWVFNAEDDDSGRNKAKGKQRPDVD